MDPSKHATSERMPTAEDFTAMSETYARLSPHPDHFQDFMTTLSSSAADLRGWSGEALAGITAPILFVQGDRDFTTLKHAALMVELVAGSQLAILPGTTHMQVTGHPALPVLLEGFLA